MVYYSRKYRHNATKGFVMSKRKYTNQREPVITDFLFNLAMITGFLVILIALIVFLHKDKFDFPGGTKSTDDNKYDIELDTGDETSSSEESTSSTTSVGTDRPVNFILPQNAYFATGTVNIRSEASTTSTKLGKLGEYDMVVVDEIKDGWAKIVYSDAESGFAYVSSDYISNEADFIEKAVLDLKKAADKETFLSATIVDKTADTYTSEALLTDINELVTKYPDYLAVENVGLTGEGNDIVKFVLGNKDAKKVVLVYGNASGKSHMTERLMACQIEYYLDSLDYWFDKESKVTYRSILDDVAIHFIPYVNPDEDDALGETTMNTLRDMISNMTNLVCAVEYDTKGNKILWNENDKAEYLEQYTAISDKLLASTGYEKEHSDVFPQWFSKEVPYMTLKLGKDTNITVKTLFDIWNVNKDTAMIVANYYAA